MAELDTFEGKCAQRYPAIAASWRGGWEHVRPFLDLPTDLRPLTDTTNAIEPLNFQLRNSPSDPSTFTAPVRLTIARRRSPIPDKPFPRTKVSSEPN